MKKFYLFLLLSTTSLIDAKTIKHTIKSGETLYSIAHANHTTIKEVRELNRLKKNEPLKVGRVLEVPTDTYFPQKKKSVKKTKIVKHTIKKGETLYSIAHRNHTTIKEVIELNKLKKDEVLKLGRVLKIPTDTYFPQKQDSSKKESKIVKHTIKSGETLYSIAHANHTSIKEVVELNRLKKNEPLKIGKVLRVPTNTYFPNKENIIKLAKKKKIISKHKLVKKTVTKKRKIKVAKHNKKANKKLLASLSKLEKIPLKKKKYINVHKEKENWFSFSNFFNHSNSRLSNKIVSIAKNKLGRRYVWGATGERNTFDCSGFTSYVYKKNGIKLPRRAIAQSKYGKYISRKNLKKGDLIFFDTSRGHRGYVNHVGIYLGNGKFIHASSAKKKVVITNLNKTFYSERYKGARRPSSS